MEYKLFSVCQGIRCALAQPFDTDYIEKGVFELRFDDFSSTNYLLNALPPNARKTYDGETTKKKCRILMGTDAFNVVNRQIFILSFPELIHVNSHDLCKLLKTIIDNFHIYEDVIKIKENIHNFMIKKNQTYIKFESFIQRYAKKSFVEFYDFNIIGCPHSTDIDVVALVSRNDIDKEIDIDELKRQLNKIGYDTRSRPVDVNLIYVDKDGNLEWSEKGDIADTQNIIFDTWKHHKQAYPCVVARKVPIDIKNKISAAGKFILDNMKVLIGKKEYKIEREKRKAVYANEKERLDYAISLLNKILHMSDDPRWNDAIKSLTMKIIQIMINDRNQEMVYTKEELANAFDMMYSGRRDNALWFLFRGKMGEYDENFLKILFLEFKHIAGLHPPKDLHWVDVTIDTSINPTDLPNDLIADFISNPIEPTEAFIMKFEHLCPDRNINAMFHIHCQNTHLLSDTLKENHIIEIDQRTEEWVRLLTFYLCGKNTGVHPYDGPEWVKFYYNLIRGSIVELFTIHTCDFSSLLHESYIRILVGLLVEQKGIEGTPAIAPDLILLTESGKIIPVEIKCIEPSSVHSSHSVAEPFRVEGIFADNHHYRRAITLATKQIERAGKILGSNVGIIMLVYVSMIDGKAHFAPRASIIDL